MIPGARAAFYAWIHCARENPWLEGLACSHILERRNNDHIVKGGTLTQRLVKRQEVELGIKKKEQDINVQVHLVADVDHTDLLQDVFQRHVVDDLTAQQVLRGAEESLAIERCFHGAVATAMAEIE
jgi:pyrroloquinoline quinone (PQQ) biosynthesis protein C